jgi:uncharacterized membrane protein (DUF4010 family)
MADVDAISISMARMSLQTIEPKLAAQAILIAVGVNSLAKAVLAAWLGGYRLGVRVGAVSALGVAAGMAASLKLA